MNAKTINNDGTVDAKIKAAPAPICACGSSDAIYPGGLCADCARLAPAQIIAEEAAPAKVGEYHVIGLAYGRTELQRGNKHVADLTASPAVADAICNILVERATLLTALKKFAYDFSPSAQKLAQCRDAARSAIALAEGSGK